jgi:hypothetical protein
MGAQQQILAGASGGPTRINAEVRDDLVALTTLQGVSNPKGANRWGRKFGGWQIDRPNQR